MLQLVKPYGAVRLRCLICGDSIRVPRFYALNFPSMANIQCSKCWLNDKQGREAIEAREFIQRGKALRAKWAKEPKPVYELKEIPPIIIKPKKPEQGRLL